MPVHPGNCTKLQPTADGIPRTTPPLPLTPCAVVYKVIAAHQTNSTRGTFLLSVPDARLSCTVYVARDMCVCVQIEIICMYS